jgi:hypothetical protein
LVLEVALVAFHQEETCYYCGCLQPEKKSSATMQKRKKRKKTVKVTAVAGSVIAETW